MKKFVSLKDLKEGDVLQNDIKSASGRILISKGRCLTERNLDQLRVWFGAADSVFEVESNESPKETINLEQLQKDTILHLQNIYHATGDELVNSLSNLFPDLSHIYDDLRTIDDLPDDAIKIQYADSSNNHYFRVARMSIALASIYNKEVPTNKKISLDSICLASLLYGYGKRFRSHKEELPKLQININDIKEINIDRKLLDGTYKDSLTSLYSYVAFKDIVSEDVRSIILYCNHGNSAVKPPANTNSPSLKAASIISICDIYDTLLEYTISNDISAPYENVISYMNQLSHNNSLDGDLYRLFLRHIPIYPQGTKIQLSSGQIGVVVDRVPDFPTRPKVLVLSSNKTEVIDLSETLNVTITKIVQDPHSTVNIVDSLHQEQLKNIQVAGSSKPKVSDYHHDSIVLKKGTADEQKPLVKEIRDSFDDEER